MGFCLSSDVVGAAIEATTYSFSSDIVYESVDVEGSKISFGEER